MEATGALDLATAALRRGAFAEARVALETALSQDTAAGGAPLVHELLAQTCLALEDYDAALLQAAAAFRMRRSAGECRRAALIAITLASVHHVAGSDAAARAWLERAGRLLDGEGDCIERGYLAVAIAGCDTRDLGGLLRDTELALALARQHGDTTLEMRALADSGLALVVTGRVPEGMARLEEAMTAVVAGEMGHVGQAGLACCAMLHACDRTDDVERAADWCRAVTDYARAAFGDPPARILLSHCRIAYGSMLVQVGRWDEAEVELRCAVETSRARLKQAEGSGRLAEVLVRRGRLGEAEAVLAGFEDTSFAAPALARLWLQRRETAPAEAVLSAALREVAGDQPMLVRLLALRAAVLVAAGDAAGAADAAAAALAAAEQVCAPGLVGLARLAAGSAAMAAEDGAAAAEHFDAALLALATVDRPVHAAEVRLARAELLRDQNPGSAVAEARAALATFQRVGARSETDRAIRLLRGLAPHTPATGADTFSLLSRREREVLELLAEGLTNAQIARRLVITTRTAEHHVAAVLSKLGLRRRSEAAAQAAALRPTSAAGRG